MFIHFICRVLPLLIAVYATICHAGGLTGGTKTKIQDHPYVVSLQLKNGTHICGGALIEYNMLVTSGQCLLHYKPLKVYARLGTNRYDSSGELIPICAYRINSKFNFSNMKNDIAVVKLEESFHKSDKQKKIKLAKKQPKTGKRAKLTGWNTKKELVEVEEDIIRRKECRSGKYIYKKKDIKRSMICAEPKKRKICDGEAGSPLVYKDRLVGLTSWAYTCANKGSPYVYTNIAKVRNWIKKAKKKLKKM